MQVRERTAAEHHDGQRSRRPAVQRPEAARTGVAVTTALPADGDFDPIHRPLLQPRGVGRSRAAAVRERAAARRHGPRIPGLQRGSELLQVFPLRRPAHPVRVPVRQHLQPDALLRPEPELELRQASAGQSPVQSAAVDTVGVQVRLLNWGKACGSCTTRAVSVEHSGSPAASVHLRLTSRGWPRSKRRRLLVQQGRLDEAEQQARLALDNPETRAVAYSVLGTIRLQQTAASTTAPRSCARRSGWTRTSWARTSISRRSTSFNAIRRRALDDLRRGAAHQAGFDGRAATGRSDRGTARRARAFALLLDPRAKLAADDPEVLLGIRSRLLEMDLLDDAEPALTKAASLETGRSLVSIHAGRGEGGQTPVRGGAGAARTARASGSRRTATAVRARVGALHPGTSRRRRRASSRSVRLQPEQLASHHYLALIARDQGRDAEAIAMLEALVKRYPHHVASCEALGSLLMSAQRYDEAGAHICGRRCASARSR